MDRNFIKAITPGSWGERTKGDRETQTAVMEASVLMFSDTQAIAGMSILLCGYLQLDEGLSSYHWQMVISLAWFSSFTHLATLTALRGYFCDRPGMAMFRGGKKTRLAKKTYPSNHCLGYMAVLLVLLIVSHGTAGYLPQISDIELSWPAKCLFSPAGVEQLQDVSYGIGWRRPYNVPFVVLTTAFLVISYLTRIVRIFNRTAKLAKTSLKTKPREYLRRRYGRVATKAEEEQRPAQKALRNAMAFGIAVLYIILKALYNIGESMLWEVH